MRTLAIILRPIRAALLNHVAGVALGSSTGILQASRRFTVSPRGGSTAQDTASTCQTGGPRITRLRRNNVGARHGGKVRLLPLPDKPSVARRASPPWNLECIHNP